MGVFWIGWGKKLKSIFSKKEADTLYLNKTGTTGQGVEPAVTFHNNVSINGIAEYRTKSTSPNEVVSNSKLISTVNPIKQDITALQNDTGTLQTEYIQLAGEIATTNTKVDKALLLNDTSTYYFANNKRIGGVAEPTNIKEAVNLFYLSQRLGYQRVYSDTIEYKNLQEANITIDSKFTFARGGNIFFIKFGRYNFQTHNSLGYSLKPFVLPSQTDKPTWVGEQLYYDIGGTGHVEIGNWIVIKITYVSDRNYKLTFQCFDANDRIKDISIYALDQGVS